jgi:hypothetical protein
MTLEQQRRTVRQLAPSSAASSSSSTASITSPSNCAWRLAQRGTSKSLQWAYNATNCVSCLIDADGSFDAKFAYLPITVECSSTFNVLAAVRLQMPAWSMCLHRVGGVSKGCRQWALLQPDLASLPALPMITITSKRSQAGVGVDRAAPLAECIVLSST